MIDVARMSLISLTIILFSILTLVCSCKVTTVTQREVDDRLVKDLPKGSTVPQVVAFLESIEINGLKVHQYGYIPRKPVGTAKLPGMEDEVQGYLLASIDGASRDSLKMQVYRISMIFYFDKGERLIEYRTSIQGDW